MTGTGGSAQSGAGDGALVALGWDDGFAEMFRAAVAGRPDGVPARVVAVDGAGSYLVAGPDGMTGTGFVERRAVLTGRARHRIDDPAMLPAVGDWVVLARGGGDGDARVEAVLARRSWFARRAPGDAAAEQVLAANIDTVLMVVSLEIEPNLRRFERYLAMAWEGGAQPVVLLTKADLHPDLAGVTGAVAEAAPGVPVIATSARTGLGLDELGALLTPARTLALLGASGAGKSTLVNRLLGEERQVTAATRQDGRGRHTTTRRQLLRLPGGALLIDTPGLRTVLLGMAGDGVDRAFAEIAALADGCRFRDCRHESEPGCAVLAAVADGTLDPERLDGWRKLQRELAWLEARDDPFARALRGRQWRSITKASRGLHRN